jgi:preprotein translocase subunit SecY
MATISGITSFYKLPDLRRRVFFTLAMLAVYRAGVFVSIPGVDRAAMNKHMAGDGGLMGLVNLFSGGALGQLSVFALGIMPYISAGIILQLGGMVYAPITELRKEGQAGQRKIDQWTRYGTVAISLFQSYGIAKWAESISNSGDGAGIVSHGGLAFELMTMITLTTGTAFLMWLGEQITERGVSNGVSLIIFAGIVCAIPTNITQYVQQHSSDMQPLTVAIFVGLLVLVTAAVVFFENGKRQIPIVYSRRQIGKRAYGGGPGANLPLKVNISGTIPPIFASSLLMFPATIASTLKWTALQEVQNVLNRGGWVFNTGYGLLIIFFCFFYTNITFQAVDVAENLKKQQANIPGIRPGKQTADYIYNVVQRITVGGSLYVAVVCVLPSIIGDALNVTNFQFGGTSLMIVVGVALDTAMQIEAQLIQRNYEGLSGPGAGRVRGRRIPEGQGA